MVLNKQSNMVAPVVLTTAFATGLLFYLGIPSSWVPESFRQDGEGGIAQSSAVNITKSGFNNFLNVLTNGKYGGDSKEETGAMPDVFKDQAIFVDKVNRKILTPDSAESPPKVDSVFKLRPDIAPVACEEKDCISAAEKATKNRDNKINPCDDFYGFVCGNYVQNNPLLPGQKFTNELIKTEMETRKKIQKILQEPINEDQPEYITKLKRTFKACEKQSVTIKKFRKYIAQFMDFLGCKELFINHKKASLNWIEVLKKMYQLGFPVTYLFTVDVVHINRKRNYLTIDKMQFITDLNFVGAKIKPGAFTKYIREILNSATETFTEKFTNELFKFTDSLLQIINEEEVKFENGEVPETVELTIDEMMLKYPEFHWLDYFSVLLNMEGSERITVHITNVSYIKKLMKLLKDSPNSTIVAYLILRAIESIINTVDSVWTVEQNFLKNVNPFYIKPTRKEFCVTDMQKKMPHAITASFVKKYFSPESKYKTIIITREILKKYDGVIASLDWSDIDKDIALNKISSIDLNIGYLEEILDDNNLNNYYNNLTISIPEDYLSISLKLNKLAHQKKFESFFENFSNKSWESDITSAEVQASYDVSTNSLYFPAFVLQDNFFNPNYPSYSNYGAIGTIIGQEIVQTINEAGRYYGTNGNFNNWWSKLAEKDLKTKKKCLLEQHDSNNNLHDEKEELEKLLMITMTNFAGFKTANLAFTSYIDWHGPEPTIKEYTNRQLFWIVATNIWCSNPIENLLPNKLRINWPLMNLKSFSDDFKCPIGSPMNPLKKCVLW